MSFPNPLLSYSQADLLSLGTAQEPLSRFCYLLPFLLLSEISFKQAEIRGIFQGALARSLLKFLFL